MSSGDFTAQTEPVAKAVAVGDGSIPSIATKQKRTSKVSMRDIETTSPLSKLIKELSDGSTTGELKRAKSMRQPQLPKKEALSNGGSKVDDLPPPVPSAITNIKIIDDPAAKRSSHTLPRRPDSAATTNEPILAVDDLVPSNSSFQGTAGSFKSAAAKSANSNDAIAGISLRGTPLTEKSSVMIEASKQQESVEKEVPVTKQEFAAPTSLTTAQQAQLAMVNQPQVTKSELPLDEAQLMHQQVQAAIAAEEQKLKALEEEDAKVEQFNEETKSKSRRTFASFLSRKKSTPDGGQPPAAASSGTGVKRSTSLMARAFGGGKKTDADKPAEQPATTQTKPSVGGLLRGLSLRKARPASTHGPPMPPMTSKPVRGESLEGLANGSSPTSPQSAPVESIGGEGKTGFGKFFGSRQGGSDKKIAAVETIPESITGDAPVVVSGGDDEESAPPPPVMSTKPKALSNKQLDDSSANTQQQETPVDDFKDEILLAAKKNSLKKSRRQSSNAERLGLAPDSIPEGDDEVESTSQVSTRSRPSAIKFADQTVSVDSSATSMEKNVDKKLADSKIDQTPAVQVVIELETKQQETVKPQDKTLMPLVPTIAEVEVVVGSYKSDKIANVDDANVNLISQSERTDTGGSLKVNGHEEARVSQVYTDLIDDYAFMYAQPQVTASESVMKLVSQESSTNITENSVSPVMQPTVQVLETTAVVDQTIVTNAAGAVDVSAELDELDLLVVEKTGPVAHAKADIEQTPSPDNFATSAPVVEHAVTVNDVVVQYEVQPVSGNSVAAAVFVKIDEHEPVKPAGDNSAIEVSVNTTVSDKALPEAALISEVIILSTDAASSNDATLNVKPQNYIQLATTHESNSEASEVKQHSTADETTALPLQPESLGITSLQLEQFMPVVTGPVTVLVDATPSMTQLPIRSIDVVKPVDVEQVQKLDDAKIEAHSDTLKSPSDISSVSHESLYSTNVTIGSDSYQKSTITTYTSHPYDDTLPDYVNDYHTQDDIKSMDVDDIGAPLDMVKGDMPKTDATEQPELAREPADLNDAKPFVADQLPHSDIVRAPSGTLAQLETSHVISTEVVQPVITSNGSSAIALSENIKEVSVVLQPAVAVNQHDSSTVLMPVPAKEALLSIVADQQQLTVVSEAAKLPEASTVIQEQERTGEPEPVSATQTHGSHQVETGKLEQAENFAIAHSKPVAEVENDAILQYQTAEVVPTHVDDKNVKLVDSQPAEALPKSAVTDKKIVHTTQADKEAVKPMLADYVSAPIESAHTAVDDHETVAIAEQEKQAVGVPQAVEIVDVPAKNNTKSVESQQQLTFKSDAKSTDKLQEVMASLVELAAASGDFIGQSEAPVDQQKDNFALTMHDSHSVVSEVHRSQPEEDIVAKQDNAQQEKAEDDAGKNVAQKEALSQEDIQSVEYQAVQPQLDVDKVLEAEVKNVDQRNFKQDDDQHSLQPEDSVTRSQSQSPTIDATELLADAAKSKKAAAPPPVNRASRPSITPPVALPKPVALQTKLSEQSENSRSPPVLAPKPQTVVEVADQSEQGKLPPALAPKPVLSTTAMPSPKIAKTPLSLPPKAAKPTNFQPATVVAPVISAPKPSIAQLAPKPVAFDKSKLASISTHQAAAGDEDDTSTVTAEQEVVNLQQQQNRRTSTRGITDLKQAKLVSKFSAMFEGKTESDPQGPAARNKLSALSSKQYAYDNKDAGSQHDLAPRSLPQQDSGKDLTAKPSQAENKQAPAIVSPKPQFVPLAKVVSKSQQN